jgi:hypothetical protein
MLSEAEIDALEYVVEEGRIACMDDYGILRSWLIRLRPEWESQSYEESDEKRTNTTMSRDDTPGEGSVQGEGTITTRLRQTRADMIGTDDEQHYWDCHDAAAEIDRLRLELSVQKSCTVAGRQEIDRLRSRLEKLS